MNDHPLLRIRGQKLGLVVTALVVLLVTALTWLAVARQTEASRSNKRLEDLGEQNRQALTILRCSSGVTVLIPASDPAWRLQAYQKCLELNDVPASDPFVERAVEETSEAPLP